MEVKVWSDGILNWNGENMKEFTLEEMEANKPEVKIEVDYPMSAEWAYATQPPSADNDEYENAGDFLHSLEEQARDLSDLLPPVSLSYNEETTPDSDSDLPVIYEAYAFPTPGHREEFLHTCISDDLIVGCSWDHQESSTEEGSKAVVLVSENGIGKVYPAAKKYLGKEIE